MAKKKRNAKANSKPKRTGKSRFPLLTERRTYTRAQLEEIARAQGKELRPCTDEDFKLMIELGKQLFRSHKEREEFFAGIEERRRQSRGK
jgi:hypothetical protein